MAIIQALLVSKYNSILFISASMVTVIIQKSPTALQFHMGDHHPSGTQHQEIARQTYNVCIQRQHHSRYQPQNYEQGNDISFLRLAPLSVYI